MLEQVAIVAGELDNKAVFVVVEHVNHFVGIGLGVSNPTIRIGREISVFFENRLDADVFLQLHQETVVTQQNMQREESLALIKLGSGQESFAQRRHSQIHKSVAQSPSAKPADAHLTTRLGRI